MTLPYSLGGSPSNPPVGFEKDLAGFARQRGEPVGAVMREQQPRLPMKREVLSLDVGVVLVHAVDQVGAVLGVVVDVLVDVQVADRPIDAVGVGARRVFLDLLEDPELGLVVVPGDDDAGIEVHEPRMSLRHCHPPLDVALDGPQVAVVEGHVGRAGHPDGGHPHHGVVDAVALPAVGEQQLFALQLQPGLVHGHGDGGLGGDVGTEAVDGPHVDLVAGGEHHVLDHARQGHDLGLREGVRKHGQSEVVVGVEVRHVDVGEVLPHGDDLGDHPVSVAQKLRRVDEDGVPFAVEQGGVAVEAQIAVQEDLVLQRHVSSLLRADSGRAHRAPASASEPGILVRAASSRERPRAPQPTP